MAPNQMSYVQYRQITICYPFCKAVCDEISTLKNDKIKSYFVTTLDMFVSNSRPSYYIFEFSKSTPFK